MREDVAVADKTQRFPDFRLYYEKNYTVTKDKKCNEKSFSRDAHSDAGVSFQVQLLLEF